MISQLPTFVALNNYIVSASNRESRFYISRISFSKKNDSIKTLAVIMLQNSEKMLKSSFAVV